MKIILIFVRNKSSYICSKEFLYLSKMNWFLKMKKLLILVPKKLIFPKEKKLLYFLVNNFCKVLYFRCVFNTAAFFFMRPKLNRVLDKTNETPSLCLNLYGKILLVQFVSGWIVISYPGRSWATNFWNINHLACHTYSNECI